MRLFVAVDLPGPVVRLLESLPRPARRSLRWTSPDQWHVTLRFLGEVEESDPVVEALGIVAARCAAGSAEAAEPVEARLGPATAWFTGRRVLQVPVAGLEELATFVRDATAPWGSSIEAAFAGHVTLARVRGDKAGPPELAGTPVVARFDVTGLVLYASSLHRERAVYQRLATVPIVPARRG